MTSRTRNLHVSPASSEPQRILQNSGVAIADRTTIIEAYYAAEIAQAYWPRTAR